MSEIRRPVLAVNFKAYGQVEGPGAVDLAIACQDVSAETGVCIAACPPTVELSAVARAVRIPVLSQGLDPLDAGPRTGWVTPSAVRACGCAGTLLNHSERTLGMNAIADAVARCRRSGLATVVCADSEVTAAAAAEMRPDFIAVEPPALIGGDVSVTTASPEAVSETVRRVRAVDEGIGVLCGAGVKNSKDVSKALDLGADGVLLASGVVKAADWRAVLRELASGF